MWFEIMPGVLEWRIGEVDLSTFYYKISGWIPEGSWSRSDDIPEGFCAEGECSSSSTEGISSDSSESSLSSLSSLSSSSSSYSSDSSLSSLSSISSSSSSSSLSSISTLSSNSSSSSGIDCNNCTPLLHDEYSINLSGFTGDFAFVNGSHILPYKGDCSWYDDGVYNLYWITGGTPRWLVAVYIDGGDCYFTVAGNADSCSPTQAYSSAFEACVDTGCSGACAAQSGWTVSVTEV